MFSDPLVKKLANFVRSVDIEVKASTIDWKTLFPGLEIDRGVVLIDEAQLIHPGNILHEAGRLVRTPLACLHAGGVRTGLKVSNRRRSAFYFSERL